MNLNEVKKHVTFQLILYIFIGLCFLLSIFAILTTPVKAKEVSTNMTNSIYPGVINNYGCNSTTRGRYCAIPNGSQPQIRSFNTTYNGVLSSLEFAADFNFRNNTTYTFDIYANSNDFRNNNVTASCYSYTNFPSQAVPISCSYRFISKTHLQVVYPYNTYSSHEIHITGTQVTGDTNYNLKSVYVTYDDGQQDFTGVIDNATNNTTDIINNNNSNAQDTQNVIIAMNNRIMETLSKLCKNFFNYKVDVSQIHYYNILANYSVTDNSVSMTSNGNWSYIIFPISVSRNTTYYVKYSRTNSVNNDTIFQIKDNYGNNNDGVIATRYDGGLNASYSMTFNSGNNTTLYVRLYVSTSYSGNTVTFNNLMISPVDEPYCVYGSFSTSKLDEIGGVLGGLSGKVDDTNSNLEDVKDLQQEQNDYLMDDTNPSIPTSDIDNVMDSVEVSDPLNYLLVLPINLLHKLNQVLSSNSCQRVSFGSLYETEIYLPCINFEQILGSNIWNTIDLIVGVGLLAIILKRFYDSISNVLTLGKEKEVRDKLDLPTPMQFMASILGGGRD